MLLFIFSKKIEDRFYLNRFPFVCINKTLGCENAVVGTVGVVGVVRTNEC
jgi:hypothetical protein